MTSTPNSVTGNNGPRRAKRILLMMGGGVLVLIVGVYFFLMNASYSNGFRVGTIQKVSKKGIIFKTYEGELSQGFIDNSQDAAATGVGTRVWTFTVEKDPEVLKQIDHAIETNKKVKLYYNERYKVLPWVGDTAQIVFKVEEVQ